jgi:hypothetical protein
MTHQGRPLTASEEMRLFLGLVIQPLLASSLAFLGFPVFLLDQEGRSLAGGFPANPTDAALSVALGVGVVAVFVTVVGVWPTAVWLTKRHAVPLKEALVFGLAFGNLPYALLAVAVGGRTYGVEGLARGVAFSSFLGLAGAAAFWVIALRQQRVVER